MKRPKLASVLSAVLGSTAAFLVLSRWGLAGTVAGSVLMPVIFTLVSFWSHESIERAGKWIRRSVKRSPDPEPLEAEDTEESQVAEKQGWRAFGLQWVVVALAFFAFAVSLYSLTHEPDPSVTVLREKVIETVTVTSGQSALSASGDAQVPTVTLAPQTAGGDSTTTTLPLVGPTQTTSSTVTTAPGSATTTSLP